MKKTGFIFFILLSLSFFSINTHASEIENEIISSIENDLSRFEDALPDNVKEFFPNEIFHGDFSQLINGSINEKTFLELTASYLLSGIDTVIKTFSSILLLIVISSIFSALSSSLNDSNIKTVFSLCSTLCMAVTVVGICNTLIGNATAHIKMLNNSMNAFLPIMVTLLTMSGNISSAVIANGSMLLFISIVDGFLLAFMLPIIKMCLAFGCANSLNDGLDLSGISRTVKSTFTSVTVFVMSIFLFVLSYKNTLSQSVDTISLKTARFAISSFVPLVGSSVNEALRTVSSSLSLIKNSCGIIAIIAIVVLMLPILINLFLNKLSFSILSSMAKAINSNKEAVLLDEADSICTFILTLVACSCVLFIFSLTIFIKTGVGITV